MPDLGPSGFATVSQITTSGYVRHSEMLTSGYLRHQDLLSSGYVRSINGLKNTPTIVGSGGTAVWVDGQTIQVGSVPGGGSEVKAGSGIHSVVQQGNAYYINASGVPLRYVASDLPWNSTNLANVSGLEYSIGPGEVVAGEAIIWCSVAAAATGIGFSLNGPASPVFVRFGADIPLTTGTSFKGATTAYESKVQAVTGVATILIAYLNFLVINGPNAGTLVPRVCSEGTTVVTVHRGSYAKYNRIS